MQLQLPDEKFPGAGTGGEIDRDTAETQCAVHFPVGVAAPAAVRIRFRNPVGEGIPRPPLQTFPGRIELKGFAFGVGKAYPDPAHPRFFRHIDGQSGGSLFDRSDFAVIPQLELRKPVTPFPPGQFQARRLALRRNGRSQCLIPFLSLNQGNRHRTVKTDFLPGTGQGDNGHGKQNKRFHRISLSIVRVSG